MLAQGIPCRRNNHHSSRRLFRNTLSGSRRCVAARPCPVTSAIRFLHNPPNPVTSCQKRNTIPQRSWCPATPNSGIERARRQRRLHPRRWNAISVFSAGNTGIKENIRRRVSLATSVKTSRRASRRLAASQRGCPAPLCCSVARARPRERRRRYKS